MGFSAIWRYFSIFLQNHVFPKNNSAKKCYIAPPLYLGVNSATKLKNMTLQLSLELKMKCKALLVHLLHSFEVPHEIALFPFFFFLMDFEISSIF